MAFTSSGWLETADSLQGGGPVFDSRGYITGVAFCKASKKSNWQHGHVTLKTSDFFGGGKDSNMAMLRRFGWKCPCFFSEFSEHLIFVGQTCNPCNPDSPPNLLVDRMSAIVRTTSATLGSKGGCVWTLLEIKLRPTPLWPARNIQH